MKKSGEWIFLTKPIPTEIPVGRMEVYFAKPCKRPYLRHSRTPHGINELSYRHSTSLDHEEYQYLMWRFVNDKSVPDQYKISIETDALKFGYGPDDFIWPVKIVTPFGEVKIWAEEYNIVSLDWALDLVAEEALMIRYLNNDGSVRDNLKNVGVRDQVFYLQSRGLSFRQAMKYVSGEIKSQHLFYFDPYPHYVQVFERHYERLAERKIEYCKKHNAEQLLMYKDSENGEFTIMDFLNHLNKQEQS